MNQVPRLITLLSVEFRKSRHKHTFLLLAASMALNYFFLFYGTSDKEQGWLNVFYAIPLTNTIVLSIQMTVLASQSVDLENRSAMWNLLPTLTDRASIYLGKLLYGLIHLTLFCLLQMGMVVLLGTFLGFNGVVPFQTVMTTFAAELIGGMIVFQVQCLLSLLFSNQFAALSVGFGGTLTGLFLAYISTYVWTPWSVLLSLSAVGMNYEESSRTMTLFWQNPSGTQLLIALLYLTGTFLLGLCLFTKSEQGERSARAPHRQSSSLHNVMPVELIKLKRSPVWIPFLLIPLIAAAIGTINFTQNQGVLQFTWEDLWAQHSLFLGAFFLAPLIGILCSLLWRMEHQGGNWNLIMTAVAPFKPVKDKWLTAALLASLSMLWVAAIYLFTGKLLALPGGVPVQFWSRMLCAVLCVAVIAAVQSMLSLIFRSFAVPVALAFAGSIAGLAMVAKGTFYVSPYAMLIYGMGSTSITGDLNLPVFLVSCLLYLCGALTVSTLVIKMRDVRTHV